MTDVLSGLLIPFAGTTLGAACVLFVKKEMNVILQRALTGGVGVEPFTSCA